MILTREELDQVLVEARAEAPREACGFLLRHDPDGESRHIPATNVHRQPERCFAIDPPTMLRVLKEEAVGGWGVHAVYHSHPGRDTTSKMSAEDRRGARAFALASYYVIVALPAPDFWEAAAWRWDLDRKAWGMAGCAIGTFEARWMDQPDQLPLVAVS